MSKLLTKEEEIALARKARQGDIEARNELVERNLGLASLVLRRTKFLNLDTAEALSISYRILVNAASLFDPDRGYKFSTYAYNAIMKNLIKSASHKTREFILEAKDQDALSQIAVDYRETNYQIDEETINLLHGEIRKLSYKQQRVLYLRYFAEYSLEQVGNEFGLSKERIRQIQEKALKKLRACFERKGLEAEVVLS